MNEEKNFGIDETKNQGNERTNAPVTAPSLCGESYSNHSCGKEEKC